MGIADEYDRDIEVEAYIDGKKQMVSQLGRVTSILDAAVVFKTKYPADAAEVDVDIAWVKNKCQEIINEY